MYSQKKLLASKMAEMNLLKQEDNAIEKLRKQIDDQLNRLRVCTYYYSKSQSLLHFLDFYIFLDRRRRD